MEREVHQSCRLSAQEKEMLEAIMVDDDRENASEMIRLLIRRDYKRRFIDERE